MSSTGKTCTGDDAEETSTFFVRQLPRGGIHHFKKISPKGAGTRFTPAVIESVTQAEPLGGKIQIGYSGKLGCSERAFASHQIMFPLSSGNSRHGLLVLAEDLGNQCSKPPSSFWDQFEAPEIPGGYSFVPVD